MNKMAMQVQELVPFTPDEVYATDVGWTCLLVVVDTAKDKRITYRTAISIHNYC